MKIEKKVFTEALRQWQGGFADFPEARQVRFLGCGDTVTAMATDGSEVITLCRRLWSEDDVDFAIEYKAPREMVRTAKGALVLQGDKAARPEVPVVPISRVGRLAGELELLCPPRWTVGGARFPPTPSADGLRSPTAAVVICRWTEPQGELDAAISPRLAAAAPQPGKLWCQANAGVSKSAASAGSDGVSATIPTETVVIPEDKSLDYRITPGDRAADRLSSKPCRIIRLTTGLS